MILRISQAICVGPHRLQLTFNDGVRKSVNVRPLLEGPIFEPLLNPDFFARVALDQRCGTVVWPNGADFAPEALHELPNTETSAEIFNTSKVFANNTKFTER